VGECIILVTDQFTPVAYFSFNQAWVVFFPALVPLRSWATYAMILFAAALPPLSRALIQSLGLMVLPDDSLTILSLVMMFSAIMGLVVSHVVYKMGKSVTAAREMGSYTLEENLGGGGMGEVWMATHRMLARPAAVKLVKPDVVRGMQPGEIQHLNHRFEHEVQATAALCSPHTVDIYDYGLAQDGTFYYVMELLDGVDMETLVERFGPVEPSRAVNLLVQACHSLNEAHRRQLIHRDIKPANLFVCRYGDDFDFVKVLDFGLVKEVSGQGSKARHLTQPDLVMGTPDFMPPELALGEKEIDGRSDLYALGCVAYWLLTGTRLFSADSPMQALMKHINEIPEVPSKRSELAIPPELDALVLRCLEKDPTSRPQGAEEMSALLNQIPFDRPWSNEDARRWWDTYDL
jgi:serine/threonine-protein kinase